MIRVLFEWLVPLDGLLPLGRRNPLLVRKPVGDCNIRHSGRLATILRDIPGNGLFVKMDIEGAEVPVISASRDFLRWDKDIRLACCTYHNAGDAESPERIFHEAGYLTEFSDGWMLPTARHLSPPYFRRGVVRAWRGRILGLRERGGEGRVGGAWKTSGKQRMKGEGRGGGGI